MKKIIAAILVIVIFAAGGAYWFWLKNKKGIVKHFIQQTVEDKTDGLYYLKYDSSMIDEVNGDAYFRNIYLQSDSEQAAMLQTTDSLPNVLINIYIKAVTASGIDMQAYIDYKVVHAKSILIESPIIQIINTGANQLRREDTLAIYEKIVGEFNSIKADRIEIRHCTFISKMRNGEVQTRLNNAEIVLTQFKVDSTRDYSNILSYFVNNLEAKVDSLYIKGSEKLSKFYLTKVHYNSVQRSMDIGNMVSFTNGDQSASSKLNNVRCSNLNVNAFIQQHRLQAGVISCEGGYVTVYYKKKEESNINLKNKSFEFPEAFFDEVEIGSVQLGNTNIILRDKENPKKQPVTISNVKFSVSNEINVTEGKTFRNIMEKAKWKLSTDGFTFLTKDNLYSITIKGVVIDRQMSTAMVRQILVTPQISEKEFVRQSKKQGDYYHITFSNILLNGINIDKLINESAIEMEKASLNLNLQVYNDRTLPVNHDSKVGKYPHQLLQKIAVPIYIKNASIQNSSISYRERALATQQVGNVLFSNVNGSIENITNIPQRIKQKSDLTIKASATFLNAGKAGTIWNLNLGANDGAFKMSGQIDQMNAAAFNALSLPLGMTKVSGQINSLQFSMSGNDNQAKGNLTLLYNGLNIESFKIDEKGDTMKSKKLANLFSNALIKNDNPSKGVVRNADFSSIREVNKSFFNLIWKSIFDGVQKTIMSKNGLKIQKELGKLKKKKK